MSDEPMVSVVVLAYGDEPWLERCVAALLASEGVGVEVLLVDNGCTSGAVERLEGRDGLRVLRPGGNLGFAGGCNLGGRFARGEVLALVNGDAIVAPDALRRLAAVAVRPQVGIATASIRLAEDPQRLNSAGNPIHFLGLTWAGAFGEPAADHTEEVEVAGASGAGLAVRREVWEALGGFPVAFFAYHEDAELSLRCWQRGWSVRYVPDAVVVHRYEFARNARKTYLMERNRLAFVLTLYERRTLLLCAPALLAFEGAMLVAAAVGGWLPAKVAGWRWLVANRRWLRARRLDVQAQRRVADRDLADRLTGRFDPGVLELPAALRPLDVLAAVYWAMVRRLL